MGGFIRGYEQTKQALVRELTLSLFWYLTGSNQSLGAKPNVCQESNVRITLCHSNLHDRPKSIIRIPEVRPKLPDWQMTLITLHLCVLYDSVMCMTGSCNSLFVKRWTWDWKVVNLNYGRSGRIIFFSTVNFLCWLLFSVYSTPMLPQWHKKDPSHSAKSAGSRLHLNMHTPLNQSSWSGLTMPLYRHSMGTYPEMSSHTTCQGTLGHSHLSWATVEWSWPKEWN